MKREELKAMMIDIMTKVDKTLSWYIEQFYNLGIEIIVRKEVI